MDVLFGVRSDVEGIGKMPGAYPQIGTRQPWFDGTVPEVQTIADWLRAQGFYQVDRKRQDKGSVPPGSVWYRPSDNVLMGDAVPRNFMQSPDGTVFPIDVLLTLVPRESLAADALIGEEQS